jgi:AraC-like DNA-binding protein
MATAVSCVRSVPAQDPRPMRLLLYGEKKLMRNRSLTLLEIALECGFASHAHLSYAFRERFGLVPSQFRRDL